MGLFHGEIYDHTLPIYFRLFCHCVSEMSKKQLNVAETPSIKLFLPQYIIAYLGALSFCFFLFFPHGMSYITKFDQISKRQEYIILE